MRPRWSGKLSILHEEALRGIYIFSVGALASGAEVLVAREQTLPLTDAGEVPFLRLQMTAGQLYGTSPLLPSDDLVTADSTRHVAGLPLQVDASRAVLDGKKLAPDETVEILLDPAMELLIEGGSFGTLQLASACFPLREKAREEGIKHFCAFVYLF